ncbi:MAG: redoxin domain-containing protein [Deltaproteobacteria bacterium]|nr:redoxin domain-containing protein [Deltaproteobacteria bacterium]
MNLRWFGTIAGLLAACAGAPGGEGPGETAGPAGDSEVDTVAATCPPSGPFGFKLGDTLVDLDFLDCDGHPVSLHDLCPASPGLLFHHYGWCGSCLDFLQALPELDATFGPAGLQILVVLAEDSVGRPATAQYCAGLREELGVPGTFVYDPDDRFAAYGKNGLVILTDPGARIRFKRDDASLGTVTAAIEEMLSPRE